MTTNDKTDSNTTPILVLPVMMQLPKLKPLPQPKPLLERNISNLRTKELLVLPRRRRTTT
jgi:hypothetical protein